MPNVYRAIQPASSVELDSLLVNGGSRCDVHCLLLSGSSLRRGQFAPIPVGSVGHTWSSNRNKSDRLCRTSIPSAASNKRSIQNGHAHVARSTKTSDRIL